MRLGRPRREAADHVYETWKRRSTAVAGPQSPEWTVPHGPVLVAALLHDDEVVSVLRAFVRRRALEGWGLRALLEDLDRLRSSLPRRSRQPDRWVALVREAAIAYSDEAVYGMLSTVGRDPLSGLPDLGFLSVYLEHLVAAETDSDPERAGRTALAIVTVSPPGLAMVDRLATPILVGQIIRSVVPPELLVAHVTRVQYVVVLPPLVDPDSTAEALRTSLARSAEIKAVTVDTIPLPKRREELAVLMEALHPAASGRSGVTDHDDGS